MYRLPSSAKRPMRVLHVIPTLTGGGAEKFVCALAAAFDTSSIRTAIMPVYPTVVPFDGEASNRIELIHINRTGRYDPGFLMRMVSGMRRFRPDVVHAHLHNGKYWGRLVALAARVPIVVFTEHSPLGEKRSLAESFVDGVVNRLSDGIVTFSERQRVALENTEHIPPDKLAVIENGISLPPPTDAVRRATARARLGAREDEFSILVVGRLADIKNPQLAIRAIAEIDVRVRRRVRLYIIGDGETAHTLRALARELHVTQSVAFMGHRDDVPDLLYGGDALFVPSFVEGMPLAVLEAMAVGLPVISSPWLGAQDLIGNGRFGVVLGDWNAATAANAIETAIQNGNDFRHCGERAQLFARARYDIRRSARLHERYYTELWERKT